MNDDCGLIKKCNDTHKKTWTLYAIEQDENRSQEKCINREEWRERERGSLSFEGWIRDKLFSRVVTMDLI
jgi:hypothetical protein